MLLKVLVIKLLMNIVQHCPPKQDNCCDVEASCEKRSIYNSGRCQCEKSTPINNDPESEIDKGSIFSSSIYIKCANPQITPTSSVQYSQPHLYLLHCRFLN